MPGRGRPQRATKRPRRLEDDDGPPPQRSQRHGNEGPVPEQHPQPLPQRQDEMPPPGPSPQAGPSVEQHDNWWQPLGPNSTHLHSAMNTVPPFSSGNDILTALFDRIATIERSLAQSQSTQSPHGQKLEPLSIAVAHELKERIWNGKCVDLSLLLAKSFLDRQEEPPVCYIPDTHGNLVAKPVKNNKMNLSIMQWTSAFNIFTSVYLERHPSEVQQLLAYAELIKGAAHDHPGYAWSQYDQQFRSRKEADPSRPWDMIDNQLWLQLFCQQPKPNSTVGVSTAKTLPKTLSDTPCHYFNRSRGCYRQSCLYAHRCTKCYSYLHAATTCPKPVGKGPLPPPQGPGSFRPKQQ